MTIWAHFFTGLLLNCAYVEIPSENTGLWQLTKVSSAFNYWNFHHSLLVGYQVSRHRHCRSHRACLIWWGYRPCGRELQYVCHEKVLQKSWWRESYAVSAWTKGKPCQVSSEGYVFFQCLSYWQICEGIIYLSALLFITVLGYLCPTNPCRKYPQLNVPSQGRKIFSYHTQGHKCHDLDLNPHSADQKLSSFSPVPNFIELLKHKVLLKQKNLA